MKKILLFIITISIVSCIGSSEAKEEKDLSKRSFINEEIKVAIATAKIKNFNKELVSNGKLYAKKKAQLPFEISEKIQSIFIKNGDRVSKGTLLAELDKQKLKRNLSLAKTALEKAKINMKDILLGYGFKNPDTTNIPVNVLKMSKIKSNYNSALSSLTEANYKLSLATIQAPFNGIIANLEATPYNMTSNFKNTLCTLIDDTTMQAVFPVLESEIEQINRGQEIQLFPFSQPNIAYLGKITEINPVIDKDGMVQVKAVVTNKTKKLFDGMNVKILLRKTIPNKLVVPKSAVLLRQNKKVVFTLKNGEAFWNYVETAQENSAEIVIIKGIEEGEKVIIEGNLNLAHETKVTLE